MSDFINSGFGTPQNPQQQKQFQINTNLLSMFDDQSVQLRMGGMENALSIAFWLPVPTDAGKNSYPMDHRISVILPPERIAALDKMVIDDIIPAYNRGVNCTRGLFTSRSNTNMLQVSIEDGEMYLYYHRNIDENRIPKDTIRFHFTNCMTVTQYDPKTGEYAVEGIQAQFYLFHKTLQTFAADGCTGASAHGHRNSNRFSTDKIFRYLEGIAAALNVVVPSYTFGGQRQPTQSGFSAGMSASADAAPASTTQPTQIRELDDLNAIIS